LDPRRIALIALICLIAGSVPVQVAANCAPASVQGDACHTDGAPCADPDRDGGPCGANCLCTCCPGHGIVPVLMAERLAHEVRPASVRIGLLPDAPAPRDSQHGIFHPPRV
jgi:hypothetical protein